MDTNATGRFIAELRKQKGYTQKELAQKLMVTDKAVSRWETGKGFPDTSLLKPLGDILGVSVTELLSGKMIQEAEMKSQTDKIILDSLNYSKRMLGNTISIILFILGIAFILSPLFLAVQSYESYVWMILGGFMVIITALYLCLRKRGLWKLSNKAFYFTAIILQGAALVLEILPIGSVMIFAAGPSEYMIETYSYFSLLPLGYANITPMVTGILTITVIVLGIISLSKFSSVPKCKNAAFICSMIAFLFSIVPLFLFGTAAMTTASYAVSGTILLSICLQAVANRQE